MPLLTCPSGEKCDSSGWGGDRHLLWGLWGWAVHPGAQMVFPPLTVWEETAALCCCLTRTLHPLAAGLPHESWEDSPHTLLHLGTGLGETLPCTWHGFNP